MVKNTLVRFALDDAGLKELDGVLNGTTSLATSSGDPIAPMRVVNKHAKKLGDGKFKSKDRRTVQSKGYSSESTLGRNYAHTSPCCL